MHYFVDFKNFAYAELDLFTSLTLLIGKNGAGKSNLIEGVELLAALAEGKPLYELVDGNNYSHNDGLRGGLHNCIRFGKSSFTLGFKAYIGFLKKQESFNYSITITCNPFPRVMEEKLTLGRRTIFHGACSGERNDGLLDVKFDNFARGGQKPHKNMFGDRSLLSRYEEIVSDSAAGDKSKKLSAIKAAYGVRKHLQSAFVFDPNPKLMRNYARLGQNTLLKDGSNISAVLYSLTSMGENNEALENILKVIRQVPEEPFASFNFSETRQHDVLFGINSEDKFVDARIISDGTLRVIAVISALETITKGSRVVIEEFDNGLHPSRAEILMDAIKEIVKRRNLNVLLTTHNPATMNSLEKDTLENVRVCYWDALEKSAKLARLLDIPKIDTLLESSAGIGDLVTRSVFEEHLQPEFEERRKEKALKWLEGLK
ncbi:AAA family ATPase [Marinobacter sp.]|uniref:AAA family ATPase n=1 Tax=Marinobacter sp. TaxID=50741 RepID=UPI003A8EB37A